MHDAFQILLRPSGWLVRLEVGEVTPEGIPAAVVSQGPSEHVQDADSPSAIASLTCQLIQPEQDSADLVRMVDGLPDASPGLAIVVRVLTRHAAEVDVEHRQGSCGGAYVLARQVAVAGGIGLPSVNRANSMGA